MAIVPVIFGVQPLVTVLALLPVPGLRRTVRPSGRAVGARVAEIGSHDALIALGGRYAELYQIQAKSYV